MRVLLFLLIVAFSANAFAEWVFITRNHYGDSFWYRNKDLEKSGANVWVWLKTRYPEPLKLGQHSDQSYFKINCEAYSFQLLSTTYYSDNSWTEETITKKWNTGESYITSESIIGILAKTICKKPY